MNGQVGAVTSRGRPIRPTPLSPTPIIRTTISPIAVNPKHFFMKVFFTFFRNISVHGCRTIFFLCPKPISPTLLGSTYISIFHKENQNVSGFSLFLGKKLGKKVYFLGLFLR